MLPCFERSSFVHYRYYEAEVVNNGFLVPVQYTSAVSILVAPRGENFGGKMVVRVVYHFSNE